MTKDDLISRQALCEYALNQKDKSITPNEIMRFPSAYPKKGKWEYGEDESGYDGYYCSKCFGHVRWYGKAGKQSINFIKKYNYCPSCGARMDEE